MSLSKREQNTIRNRLFKMKFTPGEVEKIIRTYDNSEYAVTLHSIMVAAGVPKERIQDAMSAFAS